MKKYLILFALILIQGCSSGGDDGATPTDTNTVFNTFPPSYFITGYNKTVNLSGSDTAGNNFTVVYFEQTLAESTFSGVPAIPIQTQILFTLTNTGAFIAETFNQYYTTSASDRHYLGDDGDTATVSAVTTAIPSTTTIGDFGVIGSYTDNAGEVETQSWRLDDGSNGMAKLVILYRMEDQFGKLTGTESHTFLIDESGNRISRTVVLFDADDGVTTTLRSS